MADRKISDLTALTTPATGDLLPIVDVSEAAAADKNKSITIQELFKGVPDGTAAAPGLAFESDDGNGIYKPGTDQVAISTGGTGRLFIDASGRVGVANSSPGSFYSGSHQLVVGNTGDQGITIKTGTSDTGRLHFADGTTGNEAYRGRIEYLHSSDLLRFGTAGNSSHMAIDSSGRLLHGTSASVTANSETRNVQVVTNVNNANQGLGIYAFTSGNSAPRLDLGSSPNGTINSFTTASSSGDLCGRINFLGSDGDEFLPTARIEARVDGTAGNGDMPGRLVFSTTADGASSPTERMRIDSSGNVGIGTSSPDSTLELASGPPSFKLTRNTTASTGNDFGRILFENSAGTTLGSIRGYSESGNTDLGLKFSTGTGDTVALTIDESQRVGVGTTSPSTSLQVDGSWVSNYGTVNITGPDDGLIGVGLRNSSTYLGGVFFRDGTAGDFLELSAQGSRSIRAMTNGSEALRIDSSGRVGIGTSSPSQKLHIVVSSADNSCIRAELSGSATYETNAGQFINTDSGTGSARGIYCSGTDFGVFSNSGTNYFGGNVGIGTTSPNNLLSLVAASGGAYTELAASGYTLGTNNIYFGQESTGDALLWNRGNNHIRFATNDTERVRIDNSGRLLVGTSTARSNVVDGDGGNTLTPQFQFETANDDAAKGLSVIYGRNNTNGAEIVLGKHRSASVGGTTVVSSGDQLGSLTFSGSDGTNFRPAATVEAFVDTTPGASDMPGRLVFSTTADGAASPTERMRIDSSGRMLVGKTSTSESVNGCQVGPATIHTSSQGEAGLRINRNGDDGTLVTFAQAGTLEGTISVSGTTVSYNGAHLARWSQLPGGVERTEILRGSVLSNIDEMCDWGEEENEQLNRMKVSDVEGDKNVSGVFQAWDDDDDTYTNDFYCAMTGDFVIRIAQDVTVERGDLLMSAGDGTAKPQDDDIIRSKTIAKVTSTNVSCTYDDGSYCVPCVLMAC